MKVLTSNGVDKKQAANLIAALKTIMISGLYQSTIS
ncbi:MAG: hypothetical protein CM15mP62_00680 [Rhodospirillaceae bacterium]|nr:MAG: hypothetical protein CM15mP62_00680 [Rhodospirillaceae bacterium]